MFIKLTDSMNHKDLYLNTKAISSVTSSNRRDDEGSRVFITGESDPWYVSESVEEIMERISPIKPDVSEVFEQ